ncbi:hypothetical protein [Bacillus taeanensis]|uniref:DUF2007 domain-containing protein n=1 Tax=Bacillus taeanensis TaxID=273032 RepID=A0A366Y0Y2_9BACI|nr:hypothetical protein [Bacillus taeanensis]RBW71025.1 hypothetical protein DS031_03265 [Bacillus taeanensis]
MVLYLFIAAAVGVVFAAVRFILFYNWKIIHTAFGYKEYSLLISNLEREGVMYKIKTIIDIDNPDRTVIDQKQFDIYVKKSDRHKAHQIVKKIYNNRIYRE